MGAVRSKIEGAELLVNYHSYLGGRPLLMITRPSVLRTDFWPSVGLSGIFGVVIAFSRAWIIVITSSGVLLAALAIHPALVCVWTWGLCPRLSGSQAVILLSVIANSVATFQ